MLLSLLKLLIMVLRCISNVFNMRKVTLEIIRLFLIILFVYTATNKLLTIGVFREGLGRFPLLKSFALLLSYAVPLVEFTIIIMLIIPKFIRYGFWMSLTLIVLFTGYLSFAVLGDYELPCSCGGIISIMSWTQHLFFNLFIISIISWTLFKEKHKTQK